jgi:hypothetical protein
VVGGLHGGEGSLTVGPARTWCACCRPLNVTDAEIAEACKTAVEGP